MKNEKIVRLVVAAMLSALTCVATIAIQIPSPMNGYVNLGDTIVLLCGWLFGPIYGILSAGIGSMLADIISGYSHYAPGTFIIKGLMALTAGLLFNVIAKASGNKKLISRIVSGIAAEAIMVGGYFLYACLLLGKGLAAAASIPGNIVQGVAGILIAVILIQIFDSNKFISQKISKLK